MLLLMGRVVSRVLLLSRLRMPLYFKRAILTTPFSLTPEPSLIHTAPPIYPKSKTNTVHPVTILKTMMAHTADQ